MGDDQKKSFVEAMKCPQGTLEFDFFSEKLFDPSIEGVLMEVVSGLIHYKMHKSGMKLSFFHSTPGLKTRVAVVDLAQLQTSDGLQLKFAWSPQRIELCAASKAEPLKLICAQGEEAPFVFRVGKDGRVTQLGNVGIQVLGVNVIRNSKKVLEPSALDAWEQTLIAVEVLMTGKSPQGYMYDVVQINMAVVMLVTGLESYCKKRFVELEGGGIPADVNALWDEFSSQADKNKNLLDDYKKEAQAQSVSLLSYVVEKKRRIDFQNFEDNKNAYKKAYQILFVNELRLPNQVFDTLKKAIKHRHRVVHVSAMIARVDDTPTSEVVNLDFFNKISEAAKTFVEALHDRTLKVRPMA